MPGVPGPDGRHDDLDADQLEGLALLVPDDARSLDADRDAYLRELRQRRFGRGGPEGSRRWLLLRALGGGRPTGLAGPLLLVLLVVVGLVGSTLSVFSGSAANDLTQTPLAVDPPQPVGSVGGLLPDTTVTVRGTEFDLRGARPAVLLLVPTSCPDCGAVLRSVRSQVAEYSSLGWMLIGPAAQQPQLRALSTNELGGSAMVAADDADLMGAAYSPQGITAVLVRDDGIVALITRGLTATTRLETALAGLDARSAPSA